MMIPVYAISTGKIESLQYKDAKPMQSAINKQPFKDQMWLSKLGFVDDEQAYKDHGGPDKAVCCFSKKNYDMYRGDLLDMPEYAMFGENLTIEDLDENVVYFGNQYQLGDAIIEVSEIREPCWKIQAKYGLSDLVKRMSQSGKTGFYCRVIKEGYVSQHHHLELIKEAELDTQLSVQTLNDIYYNDRKNADRIASALKNPYLSSKRYEKLEKMYQRATK
ncbi:MOSC domain protein [Staphylococcus warneri VCU121]|jgi:MOSC domain-containing protein YiiM|nr:MOSC domain protein [Staphylococcus warneri VCU121]KKI60396.1 hypothetical protein UF68_1587 [Staphylococcus warneri]